MAGASQEPRLKNVLGQEIKWKFNLKNWKNEKEREELAASGNETITYTLETMAFLFAQGGEGGLGRLAIKSRFNRPGGSSQDEIERERLEWLAFDFQPFYGWHYKNEEI